MEFLKTLALNLWTNHRKKLITFILGLLFAGLAAVSGIPLEEIKGAAHDASAPAAVTAPAALPAPMVKPEVK